MGGGEVTTKTETADREGNNLPTKPQSRRLRDGANGGCQRCRKERIILTDNGDSRALVDPVLFRLRLRLRLCLRLRLRLRLCLRLRLRLRLRPAPAPAPAPLAESPSLVAAAATGILDCTIRLIRE